MKKRMIFLITVLAVMFGGTSAVGLAQEAEEDTNTPEANTVFVADLSVEDETTYIKYHLCNLNAEDETEAEACAEVLDDDLPDFTDEDFWTSIEVEPNENDEYNHGSFVSAFAKGYEGPGKGCLVRYIAQSDWGKEGFDVEGEDVLIEAETFCAFNRGDSVDGEDDGDGPPPWAGIGKKAWEAQQTDAESSAGGPPPWAGKKGGPGGSDD